MVMPHLGDPACRRVARHRLLLGLLLPCLAASALLLAVSGIEVVRNIESWYELPGQPGRRFQVHAHTHEDRPLFFNLHLFCCGLWLFTSPPAGATWHEVELSHSVRTSWPQPTTWWSLFVGPATVFALSLIAAPLTLLERRQRRRHSPPLAHRAIWPELALFVPCLLLFWGAFGSVAVAAAAAALFDRWGGTDGIVASPFVGPPLCALLLLSAGGIKLARIVRAWYPPLRAPNRLLCFIAALLVWAGLLIGTWLGAAWVIVTLA